LLSPQKKNIKNSHDGKEDMSVLEGKKPVNFVKYRPMSFLHRGGFIFEEGLGNRLSLSSYQLGDLLSSRDEKGNRLAYIVVDEKAWEKARDHARGKKTHAEEKSADLKAKAQTRTKELKAVETKLKASEEKAKKAAPKDANEAARAMLEVGAYRRRAEELRNDLTNIKRELENIPK